MGGYPVVGESTSPGLYREGETGRDLYRLQDQIRSHNIKKRELYTMLQSSLMNSLARITPVLMLC